MSVRLSGANELPEEAELQSHPNVKAEGDSYIVSQSFAIVRHGDRLDHTPFGQAVRDGPYPNDTPLAGVGFKHARELGHVLKDTKAPFKVIVSSPYLRCAQTASCIASVLGLPVSFDLDLGEIFDSEAMHGDIAGKIQHRPPVVLEAELKKDFRSVQFVRDENGQIQIDGQLQTFPEDYHDAQTRFCWKVQDLVRRAASKCVSIVIVTHGDAVMSVLRMLKCDHDVGVPPYTSYAIGQRQVKAYERLGGVLQRCQASIYVNPEQWQLRIDSRIECNLITDPRDKKENAAEIRADLEAICAKENEVRANSVQRSSANRRSFIGRVTCNNPPRSSIGRLRAWCLPWCR